jgi:NAD(P)-dependent dehydrogenase (short-subunit alcohol dehydrogenase family)
MNAKDNPSLTKEESQSMEGSCCVVTGATSGIGKEIARGLASTATRLAFISRDRARGEAALSDLVAHSHGGEVRMFLADLSVLEEVRRVADELHHHFSRLDVLVNNAGVHNLRPETSADGFDKMIATNHLGPFLLTYLLSDLLELGAPSRVIFVASESHRSVLRIDPDTFAAPARYGPIGSVGVYARSKLLNVLTTQEIARRWTGRGITAHAFCPGLVSTGLVRTIPLAGGLLSMAERTPLVRSPEQGAEYALRLAREPQWARRGGGFHSTTPGMDLWPPALPRLRTGLQRTLWQRSEELVGLTG